MTDRPEPTRHRSRPAHAPRSPGRDRSFGAVGTRGTRVGPSLRVRRRRAAAVVVLALVAMVSLLAVVTGGSSPTKTRPSASVVVAAGHRQETIPAVEAGVLPWSLGKPLSREVVLPGAGQSVTVVGGLDAGSHSLPAIFSLDTTSGAMSSIGALAAGIHDAAGVQLRGKDLLFGGGSPNTVAAVESFGPPGAGGTVAGTVVGSLPQPRSDASGVVIGRTAYVVGGYDGAKPDSSVLATTNGRSFKTVASLSVPVRYPAVAAVGHRIYLFGGEAVSGPNSGRPVNAVQAVDPITGSAKLVGHLPQPLAGAVAVVLKGRVYVAGGAVMGGGSATSGSAGPTQSVGDIYAFDPVKRKMLRAGSLPVPLAFGGARVVGDRAWLVGGETNGTPVSSVEMFTPNAAFGTAGAVGAGSPYFGAKLLVADRGNDRLLLLNDANQIIWTYPSAFAAAPAGGFYFPDDAFFAKGGTEIISNQEQNETIVIIGYPSGQVLWSYGHARQTGSAPGFLHEPDDAYLLKNGQVTIADAEGCRVLFINPNKSIAAQIGTNNVCKHQPPSYLGSPNGDTPLANGNVLVSEINGQWVSEYTPAAKLVWTVHLPIGYPSDPQQLGPDLYLISDYSHPGGILEFNREGQVLYKYAPTSGQGELNQPSLTEMLPSGVFMTNDDYRDRMVAIDPATQALVWQYGVTDTPGTAPGMLRIPDGFDLLLPNGTTPTHLATG